MKELCYFLLPNTNICCVKSAHLPFLKRLWCSMGSADLWKFKCKKWHFTLQPSTRFCLDKSWNMMQLLLLPAILRASFCIAFNQLAPTRCSGNIWRHSDLVMCVNLRSLKLLGTKTYEWIQGLIVSTLGAKELISPLDMEPDYISDISEVHGYRSWYGYISRLGSARLLPPWCPSPYRCPVK